MATELLERTVIQLFEDRSLSFDLRRDDLVRVVMPLDDALVTFEILDHENGLLTIRASDFVRFTKDQEKYALELCNVLNSKAFGKFLMDEYGDMSYNLDFPTTKSSGPEDFEPAFWISVASVDRFYTTIMTVRWANATIEQALERQGSGEPGAPIISDEQIRRLLGREDAEQD